MQSKSSLGSNVLNRSPWLVRARSKPLLDKQLLSSASKHCQVMWCRCLALLPDAVLSSMFS